MKHYEFLKLTPGADVVAVQSRLMKAYDKLDAELDWLNRPVIYRGCGDSADADLMTVVDIDAEEKLPLLLENPHYKKLGDKLKDLVERRMTFDHY